MTVVLSYRILATIRILAIFLTALHQYRPSTFAFRLKWYPRLSAGWKWMPYGDSGSSLSLRALPASTIVMYRSVEGTRFSSSRYSSNSSSRSGRSGLCVPSQASRAAAARST